jgi:hypothetical protein
MSQDRRVTFGLHHQSQSAESNIQNLPQTAVLNHFDQVEQEIISFISPMIHRIDTPKKTTLPPATVISTISTLQVALMFRGVITICNVRYYLTRQVS